MGASGHERDIRLSTRSPAIVQVGRGVEQLNVAQSTSPVRGDPIISPNVAISILELINNSIHPSLACCPHTALSQFRHRPIRRGKMIASKKKSGTGPDGRKDLCLVTITREEGGPAQQFIDVVQFSSVVGHPAVRDQIIMQPRTVVERTLGALV